MPSVGLNRVGAFVDGVNFGEIVGCKRAIVLLNQKVTCKGSPVATVLHHIMVSEMSDSNIEMNNGNMRMKARFGLSVKRFAGQQSGAPFSAYPSLRFGMVRICVAKPRRLAGGMGSATDLWLQRGTSRSL